MGTLAQELTQFKYREMNVSPKELFPQFDMGRIKSQYASLQRENPHQTIFNAARELWNGGYDSFLAENGFWEQTNSQFSGHCHQCTPALGLVLKSLGFTDVSYLECHRIREHFPQTGIIDPVPPQEEPNPAMRDEFCSIGRIPYCLLEIPLNGKRYYVSGKHLKPNGGKTDALLTPSCYQKMTGVFAHPLDVTKSGIYLQPVLPEKNPRGIDFSKQVVWEKQTVKDPQPELFATFLRMKL